MLDVTLYTDTDEQGRFHLQGIMGTSYWIGAVVNLDGTPGKQPSSMHSEMLPFTLRKDVTDLKIVLSQVGSFSSVCHGELNEKE
jgi:hypothetical protein